MKEIIIYEACDGKRFHDYHKCVCYEQNILKCRLCLCAIEFWDKDKKNMLHPLFNDINYEDKMYELYDHCKYLHIIKDIPKDAQNYIYTVWGWIIPFERGIYKYDWSENKWIREI